MMKRIGVSLLKILAFLGVWTLLIGAVVMSAVLIGGRDWYLNSGWRAWVEVGGAIAVLAALIFMALVVDKRGLDTIGFTADRAIFGMLGGALLGAAIFAAPLAVLTAMGAARWAPDLGDFSGTALAFGVFLTLFNVLHQEVLVRSYIFQELWSKYGALAATVATTALFVALHAAPISQGVQGLIAGANILLASLMLSLAYVRTGALWLPIGIHLGWNAFQGPVLGINVTGTDIGFSHWSVFEFPGDPLLTGGAMGVEGGLVGLIGPAIGLAVVWFAVKPARAGE